MVHTVGLGLSNRQRGSSYLLAGKQYTAIATFHFCHIDTEILRIIFLGYPISKFFEILVFLVVLFLYHTQSRQRYKERTLKMIYWWISKFWSSKVMFYFVALRFGNRLKFWSSGRKSSALSDVYIWGHLNENTIFSDGSILPNCNYGHSSTAKIGNTPVFFSHFFDISSVYRLEFTGLL